MVPQFLRRWIVSADELDDALERLKIYRACEQEKAAQIPPLRARAEKAEEDVKNLRALLDTVNVIRDKVGFWWPGDNRHARHLRLDVSIDERMLLYPVDPFLVKHALAREAAQRVENAILTLDFMLARDIGGVPR